MSDKLEANEWSQIDKFALKITEIITEEENKSLASVNGKYDRGNIILELLFTAHSSPVSDFKLTQLPLLCNDCNDCFVIKILKPPSSVSRHAL